MKILAIHNSYNKDQNKRMGVDAWRISRPLEELAKQMNTWQIDHTNALMPNFDADSNKTEFTEKEMEAALKYVSGYDVVFSSYQANPTMYTLLKVAADRAGTQYVMDVDDDLFAINEDNPVWQKLTHNQVFMMQRMIADNTWLSTTTDTLAAVLRQHRPDKPVHSTFVINNYISDVYKAVPPHNGDKLVIGFFGGSSHYDDVHSSGLLLALERIMHEHKNVHFKSVGMPIDKYLPTARIEVVDAKRGDAWFNEIYPNMQLDIAVAPLLDNQFNAGKSDIKWQEATRACSAFIGSYIGPYKKLPRDSATTVMNTEESWYTGLKKLVTDKAYRDGQLMTAQFALEQSYTLETNWVRYKDMFNTVVNSK